MPKKPASPERDGEPQRMTDATRRRDLSNEIRDAIFSVAFIEPGAPTIQAARLRYRLASNDDQKKEIAVNVGPVEIACRYSPAQAKVQLSYLFDEFLACTDAEIEGHAKQRGVSVLEESRFLGRCYQRDMDKCLDYAASILEEKFMWLLYHAFDVWCHEAREMTFKALEDQLTIDFERRPPFVKSALDYAAEFQKQRMDAPISGRPKATPQKKERVKEAERERLENDMVDAMVEILAIPEKISQERVAKNLKKGGWAVSGATSLRNKLGELGLEWLSTKHKATKNSKRKAHQK